MVVNGEIVVNGVAEIIVNAVEIGDIACIV